jgi:parallel beta-helix repeat protein
MNFPFSGRIGLVAPVVLGIAMGLVFPEGAWSAVHKTLVVPRDFPTIRAAVNAAASGDTINVKSGIYTEEIVIGKDLNLRGDGVGATIIKSPTTLTPFAADLHGQSFTAIVRVAHGAHVRISALTVTGPLPCGFVIGVVAVQSAILELTDASISNIVPSMATCPVVAGTSVQFGLGDHAVIDGAYGTIASGRVTNVVVDIFLDYGLRAAGPFGGPPTNVTFADNVITAGVPQIPTEQFGIDVFLNAVAQVTGNTVSGGVCTFEGCGPDPINEFQAMGILVESVANGSAISDNHVSGADVGIYQYGSPNCCQISDNTLQDNRFFGIVIQDGDGTASDNVISGGQVGVGVVADGINTTAVLRGNHIGRTTVALVREIQCCGFTATAVVKE